jgi:hypothetical protein
MWIGVVRFTRICHRKLPAPGFERVFNRTFRSRFLIHSSLLLKSSSHCILCSTSSKARQLPTRKSNPWSHERSFHALTSRPNSARNTYNEEFSHLPLKFHCNLSQFNRHLASLFRCRRMLELPVEVGCTDSGVFRAERYPASRCPRRQAPSSAGSSTCWVGRHRLFVRRPTKTLTLQETP